jgi:hypothetical protein
MPRTGRGNVVDNRHENRRQTANLVDNWVATARLGPYSGFCPKGPRS